MLCLLSSKYKFLSASLMGVGLLQSLSLPPPPSFTAANVIVRNSLHDELCAICPSSLLLSKQPSLPSVMLNQLCFHCDLGAPSCKIMPLACHDSACHVLAVCLYCDTS